MRGSPARRSGMGLGDRLVRLLANAGSGDPVAATEGVLREVATDLGAVLAVVWSLDPATGLLRWRQDWAAADDLEELRGINRRLTFAPGVGLPGRALAALEPIWSADVVPDPRVPRGDAIGAAGLHAAIATPMLSAEGPLGVVEFFGRARRSATDDDVDAVAIAAHQLGVYLERVSMEQRLRAVEETSAAIVESALDCIVTMDHLGRVVEFNPAAEATFGYTREEAAGRVVADLIIPPEHRDAHRNAVDAYLRTGIARILGRRLELTGMRKDGSTLPVELTVTRLGAREPPVFAGFIRDIGARRALEGEQSRLLAEADTARHQAEAALADAERARGRVVFLAQAGRLLAESMDWEATLQTVVRIAVPVVADGATVTIVEPGGGVRVVAIAHTDPEIEQLVRAMTERYPPLPGDPAGPANVIRTGEAEVVTDVADRLEAGARDAEHLELLRRIDVRHAVIAPLATPRGVIGAVSFVLGPSGRRFAPEDVQLAGSLASRAALHLQNARLYTERSHIARTLQASLRPRALPRIPGVDLAARYLAAGGHNEVGGDFYDVFLSGDGVWTAIVGDVSGKGAEAAAVTALVRHTLRTASLVNDDPGTNMALLDRAMREDSPADTFCTALYCRLCPDPEGLDVRFVNAGHPSPLLLRAGGAVETVETGRGPLVGAVHGARFEEARLSLRPGELLLLYTDGVTEIRTSDVELGERELRATLAAHAGRTADEVAAAIEQRAVELQDGSPRDDIALVALRVPPQSTAPIT